MNILDKIKVLCNQNGISLTQLEKNLSFSNGILCKWANHSPSVENLKKVSDYFNVSIEYFLENETKEIECCKHCKYFEQHYSFNKQSFWKTNYGQCTNINNLKIVNTVEEACENFKLLIGDPRL